MDGVDIPPITKAYLVGDQRRSQCKFVTPLQLFLSWRSVTEHGQIWRLATCFLYWGELSLDFFFHLFFFMRYSKMLEESAFHGRRADYVWLLLVSCTLLLILSPLSPSPFLSSPLSFTLVYLWSRLNPSVRLSLFGIITITAPYLPYALCLFSWALTPADRAGSPGGGYGWGLGVIISDLLGIAAGHWWYFWTEIWKRERASGGRNWLETPRFLVKLLDPPSRLEELEAADRAREHLAQQYEADRAAAEAQAQRRAYGR
ncbi:uncharacterized protein JCM10292_003744 [Rhodotorula paludigena]|uniref:Derlin n=1 Tax=Rhodotorula paludigena TaxID=86838 RepID=A0AAV5GM58_9BASI|nr:hypothetical protein Rhopal_003126-T1 [Rhodotorula paludigena]